MYVWQTKCTVFPEGLLQRFELEIYVCFQHFSSFPLRRTKEAHVLCIDRPSLGDLSIHQGSLHDLVMNICTCWHHFNSRPLEVVSTTLRLWFTMMLQFGKPYRRRQAPQQKNTAFFLFIVYLLFTLPPHNETCLTHRLDLWSFKTSN